MVPGIEGCFMELVRLKAIKKTPVNAGALRVCGLGPVTPVTRCTSIQLGTS